MTKSKLILSIDGGGIRGIIPATILANLEKDLDKSLYDTFDLYAGTSVGSWLVLAISALQLSGQDILGLFSDDNVKKIFSRHWLGALSLLFGPKYHGEGKREVLNQLFQNKHFLDIEKQTLITAYDVVMNKAVIFKSQGDHSDASYNPTVAEVADASSAAPTYFPSVASSTKPPRWLIDGGIVANDPALCILTETLREKSALQEVKLLSLGSGISYDQPSTQRYGKSSQTWGAIGWLRHEIIDDLFNGNTSVAEYQTQYLLNDRYYRINSIIPQSQSNLDNIKPDNITALKNIGEGWYKEHREKLLMWLK